MVLLILTASSNILDWSSEPDNEVFYEGIKLFNNKEFTKAKLKCEEAMESDPNNSEYRYYHAKAVIFESDLNFFSIARELVAGATSDDAGLQMPLYSTSADLTRVEDMFY